MHFSCIFFHTHNYSVLEILPSALISFHKYVKYKMVLDNGFNGKLTLGQQF